MNTHEKQIAALESKIGATPLTADDWANLIAENRTLRAANAELLESIEWLKGELKRVGNPL